MALGQEKGRVMLFATLSGANDSTMPAGGKETGPFDPVVDHILLKRAMVRIDPCPFADFAPYRINRFQQNDCRLDPCSLVG
jgi:hypothetical protein